MKSLVGRSLKSLLPWRKENERPEQRHQPFMMLAASEQETLFLRLDPQGSIVEQSAALRRLLPERFVSGQGLANVTMLALPWLRLAPDHWPRSLPLLEFCSPKGQVTLSGVLWPEPDGWVLVFSDITALMERQQKLENQHRLQRGTAMQAARLRACNGDHESVLWDWLEELSLQLSISWLAVAVKEQDDWKLCGQYRRPGNGAPGLVTEDIAAWSDGSSGQPQLRMSAYGMEVWSVPYFDVTGTKAWLLCAAEALEQVRWLQAEDWQQLFAMVASPLLTQMNRAYIEQLKRRYESLAQIGSGGWWQYNPHERSISISPGLAEALETHASQPLSLEQWLLHLDPMDRLSFVVHVDEAEQGKHFTHSFRLRTANRSTWYRFDGRMLGEGRASCLLGFALNVDSLRQREEEADATKARLSGLVDSAPGIIYVQRYDEGAFRFAFCSASVTALLGWTPEDFQEKPFTAFLHPEDRSVFLEKGNKLLRHGRASLQYRVRDDQGCYHWLQDEAKLLRDDRGIPVEAVGIYVDITKDKEAAERIFRSEEGYRALVDDSPAIICRYQPDLTVIFANPALASALSVDHAEVEGLNLGDYLSSEQRDSALTRLNQLSPSRPAVSSEICIRRPDMEARWWVLYEQGLFDEDGRLLEVQSVGRDNTEVHLTRQQLFQSAKMATLGEMATGLAHEINQPLSVIQMTLANLIMRVRSGQATPEHMIEKLERISGQVVRAAGIVKHVRVFGRWSGVDGVLFSPSQAVEGALSLMEQKLALQAISVVCEGIDDLPQVKGQPDRLEQVLVNLIVNASHALLERQKKEPQIKPCLGIRAESTSHCLMLIVEDNGGGIPPAILAKIFDPFFTTKSLDQGTGLGLSVSREIIIQMSGRLLVENHGEGARFTIELPLENSPVCSSRGLTGTTISI